MHCRSVYSSFVGCIEQLQLRGTDGRVDVMQWFTLWVRGRGEPGNRTGCSAFGFANANSDHVVG